MRMTCGNSELLRFKSHRFQIGIQLDPQHAIALTAIDGQHPVRRKLANRLREFEVIFVGVFALFALTLLCFVLAFLPLGTKLLPLLFFCLAGRLLLGFRGNLGLIFFAWRWRFRNGFDGGQNRSRFRHIALAIWFGTVVTRCRVCRGGHLGRCAFGCIRGICGLFLTRSCRCFVWQSFTAFSACRQCNLRAATFRRRRIWLRLVCGTLNFRIVLSSGVFGGRCGTALCCVVFLFRLWLGTAGFGVLCLRRFRFGGWNLAANYFASLHHDLA